MKNKKLDERKENNFGAHNLTPGYLNPLYMAFCDGLEDMKKQGIDIVVLGYFKFEPENAGGQFLSAQDCAYYPFELLPEYEQNLLRDEKREPKHYGRFALVTENPLGAVKYGSEGIEVIRRTHIVPFLPKLAPECELNYVTRAGVHSMDNLEHVVAVGEKSGWTPQLVKKAIDDGIQEYHEKTKMLMEQAGVYKALERMEQRGRSALNEVLFSGKQKQ